MIDLKQNDDGRRLTRGVPRRAGSIVELIRLETPNVRLQLASTEGDGTTGLSASWITRPSVDI
jgi:hypothetical protein